MPKKLRTPMGIVPDSWLEMALAADGRLAVRVLSRGSASLFGLLAIDGEAPKTLAQMDETISAAASERAGCGTGTDA